MIDFKNVPSSVAVSTENKFMLSNNFTLTCTTNYNQKNLYDELHTRLLPLETSLERKYKELEAIKQKTKHLYIPREKKEEIQLRLNWLDRLYHVKDEIENTDTKEQAETFKKVILPVQTCPMKKELLSQLDALIASMKVEVETPEDLSPYDQLMEAAIEKAGDAFINLGKAGREFVIQQVLEEKEENGEIDHVKEKTTALNEQVAALANITNQEDFTASLEKLSLANYVDLPQARKEAIAKELIKEPILNGHAGLNRVVNQFNQALTRKEQEQKIDDVVTLEDDSKIAFTMNINPEKDKDKKMTYPWSLEGLCLGN